MNPFLMSPDERLEDWKEFRESLKEHTDDKALQMVADYWKQAPLMKMVIDIEDPSQWGSPWEMIHKGDWCPYSVALGMEFTLRLSGWDKERFELLVIRDYDISEQKMILKIDESLIINYTAGKVEEYPNTKHDVLSSYIYNGKYLLNNNHTN